MVADKDARVVLLRPRTGILFDHDDGRFHTLVFGFTPEATLELPVGFTHFGFVVKGSVSLETMQRKRDLEDGDYFSVIGPATLRSNGTGFISSAKGYQGLNLFGGPLEPSGRLRYIDGCTDTLLVAPVRKGDPCLNHLHFPKSITQTPHIHPSMRTGIIYRGNGLCVPHNKSKPLELTSGQIFVIPTGCTHSFNTQAESMDVVAFHPDSDTGMTDDDHPMVNRTIVEGVSARYLDKIRTNPEQTET